MSSKQIPAGMREVSKDEFWALVMSEKRDVMPRSERNHTDWYFNHTQQSWGWCSEGYMPSGETPVYAVLA